MLAPSRRHSGADLPTDISNVLLNLLYRASVVFIVAMWDGVYVAAVWAGGGGREGNTGAQEHMPSRQALTPIIIIEHGICQSE